MIIWHSKAGICVVLVVGLWGKVGSVSPLSTAVAHAILDCLHHYPMMTFYVHSKIPSVPQGVFR